MDKLYSYDKLVNDISIHTREQHKDYIKKIGGYKKKSDLANFHYNLDNNKRKVVEIIFKDLKKHVNKTNSYDKPSLMKDLNACSDYLDIRK